MALQSSLHGKSPNVSILNFTNHYIKYIFGGGPRSVLASTPDSHAGGPGFKSWCRPTNFRPVWSPSIPIPRLKSKKGKGFPEEGEVGAEGLWFRRAPREAQKKVHIPTSLLFSKSCAITPPLAARPPSCSAASASSVATRSSTPPC